MACMWRSSLIYWSLCVTGSSYLAELLNHGTVMAEILWFCGVFLQMILYVTFTSVLAGLLKCKLQLLPSGNLWSNFPSMFPSLINSSLILCRKPDFLSHNKCGYLSSSFAVLLKTRFSQCSIVWFEIKVQLAPPWQSSSLYWSSQSQRNCLEPSADCSAALTSKKGRLKPYFCSLHDRELSWLIVLGRKSQHSKIS